jgi:hypothetical protein
VRKGNIAVQLLDAVVTPRLAHDPDVLAAWKRVKRPTESGGSAGNQPAIPTTSAAIIAPAAPAADVKAA